MVLSSSKAKLRLIGNIALGFAGLMLFDVVQAGAGGYKDFRWGMTVSEVRSLEPRLKTKNWCGVLKSLLLEVMYYEHEEILYLSEPSKDIDFINGEVTCAQVGTGSYYFSFLNGGLVSVNVFFPPDELSPLSALTKKYGRRPAQSYREWLGADYYFTSVIVWTRVSEDRVILLTEIGKEPGIRESSSLSYMKLSVYKEASGNIQRVLRDAEQKLRKVTEEKID